MFISLFKRIQVGFSNPGFQKYFENTSWLFLGRIAGLIVAFVVMTQTARYLGPYEYGVLNYITSFVAIFSFVGNVGIDGIIVRELVKDRSKKDILLYTGFILKVIGGSCAVALTTLFSIISGNDPAITLLIALFSSTFIIQSFTIIDLYFQSVVQSKKVVKIQLLSLLIVNFLRMLFIYFELGISWFVLSYVIDSIILAFGLMTIYYRKLDHDTVRFDPMMAKEIMKSGWPLMLSSAAVLIYTKIDQVIIKHMINTESVGIYSTAVRLSEAAYFVSTLVCASLFPAIVNARSVDINLYKERMLKLYSLMIYSSVAIALPVSFAASFIIPFLFGSAYEGASSVLQIYIWSVVPVFVWTATWQYLLAENYQIISFVAALLGALLNIILNIIFIPVYGIEGAAFVTLISYIVVPLTLVFFRNTRGHLSLILKSINFFRYI